MEHSSEAQNKSPKDLQEARQGMEEALGFVKWKWDWARFAEQVRSAVSKDPRVADTAQYGHWGYTALCHALDENDLPLAAFLLENGANPNARVASVHSDAPIFFAKSLEGLQLLEKHGANLHAVNEGGGATSGMNLLHESVWCNFEDDRVHVWLLETKGFDAQWKTKRGANAWHALLGYSTRYAPVDRLEKRALALFQRGVSPLEPGLPEDPYYCSSAMEIFLDGIASEKRYLDSLTPTRREEEAYRFQVYAKLVRWSEFLSLQIKSPNRTL